MAQNNSHTLRFASLFLFGDKSLNSFPIPRQNNVSASFSSRFCDETIFVDCKSFATDVSYKVSKSLGTFFLFLNTLLSA